MDLQYLEQEIFGLNKKPLDIEHEHSADGLECTAKIIRHASGSGGHVMPNDDIRHSADYG